MKKHKYEAVIKQGSSETVVRYEAFHKNDRQKNKRDAYRTLGGAYGAILKPDTVIHEIKTIG